MARHLAITADTGTKIYFCDSGSPWQRGTNENTNGLLRRYFPKSTDLSVRSPRDLARVEAELNRRPRMTLNDRTPAELFSGLLTSQHHPPLQ
jgi:IS30 family transposase